MKDFIYVKVQYIIQYKDSYLKIDIKILKQKNIPTN